MWQLGMRGEAEDNDNDINKDAAADGCYGV